MRKRVFKLCGLLGSPLLLYTAVRISLTKISQIARDVKGENILRFRKKSCEKHRRFWRPVPPKTAARISSSKHIDADGIDPETALGVRKPKRRQGTK